MNATWAAATLSLGLWAAPAIASPTLGWPTHRSDPALVPIASPPDLDFARILRADRSLASPGTTSTLTDTLDVHGQMQAMADDPLLASGIPNDWGSGPTLGPARVEPGSSVAATPVISLETLAARVSDDQRPSDAATRFNDPSQSPFLVPLPPAALPGLLGIAAAIGVASWKRLRA